MGGLNPLTGRSLFETFVIPTLLYGCETWILTESLYDILESFQEEIGKRILGISKYHTNTSTLIGLHWPTVKARILLRKLGFLAKLLSSESGISTQVFRTLSTDMCMRSVLCNSAAYWNNTLILPISLLLYSCINQCNLCWNTRLYK